MKRTSFRSSSSSLVLAATFITALFAAGCNKPSDESCRKAIKNMRSLIGTDSPTSNTDIEGDVRRCKGGSRKKAVECAGNAKTLDELRACDFMKIPASHSGSATETGSGATMGSSAGSAMGSDMSGGSAGSSAAGSAMGSGSDMSGGSAAGSASMGSAAAGSAMGSAGSGSAK